MQGDFTGIKNITQSTFLMDDDDGSEYTDTS
jgi:hypothetical protein